MPHSTREWTAEMVRALPEDGKRYELVDGELLVSPAPRLLHQRACLALYRLLDGYVREHGFGELLLAPADVEISPRDLVQPDLFVAPLVNGRRAMAWTDIRELLLAIEVISPSSARADRFVKRRLYQRAGVASYWVVDVDLRLVEQWRPGDEEPAFCATSLTWTPRDGAPALVVRLDELFDEVMAA